MNHLKSGSRGRLFFFLGLIALSFVALYFVARPIDELLTIVLSIAWATLVIVYLMVRWRSIPPVYDPQITELRRLIELQPLVGGAFLPFSGWAMDPNDLYHLVATIQFERFETIVECGSGVSTIAIGRLLRQLGQGHLYSLEEDKAWFDVMAATLAGEQLTDRVTLIHAPLEGYADIDSRWYALEKARHIQTRIDRIGLLLVDGPKSVTTHARYPALPVFAAQLDEKSLVVLDDTRRPNEIAVLERWSQEFPLRIESRPDSPRGQAYIRLLSRP
jgi:predicted O-methyltransferase YrrM